MKKRGNFFRRFSEVPRKKPQRLPRKNKDKKEDGVVMEGGGAGNDPKVAIGEAARTTNDRKVIPPQDSKWKYFESAEEYPCGEK